MGKGPGTTGWIPVRPGTGPGWRWGEEARTAPKRRCGPGVCRTVSVHWGLWGESRRRGRARPLPGRARRRKERVCLGESASSAGTGGGGRGRGWPFGEL